MNIDTLLTLAQVAERLGITYGSACTYRARNDFPAPAMTVGRSSLWSPADVDAWHAARPGRGAGGGRPRNV